MLNDRAAARATGFAGSALIALGGLGAGALPVGPLHHARAGLVGPVPEDGGEGVNPQRSLFLPERQV